MKALSNDQMEAVNGGKISWNSVGCGIGISVIFAIAAAGGPVGVATAATIVSAAGSILCSAFYD